ncbi:MAG: T9SS type A sorting domain-containing protein, partial [Chitinophagaceae bacterium]
STLYGSGSSQQDGSISSYAWKKISGPSVSIASPTSQNTEISGLSTGTYIFQLTVTSNKGATATSQVTVVVNGAQAPANKAPTANAGEDIEIILPEDIATLAGSGTDDSRVASYRWTKVSGPAGSSFEDETDPGTNVSGLVEGIYVFRLTVTDDTGLSSTDDVQLIVSRGSVNSAPTANAGADKTLTLPSNSVMISGSGTDTDGSVTSYSWRKISGPTTGSILTANSSSTQVTALVQGTYVLELTVTDNGGSSARDSMRIIVNAAANVSPVVSAGSDIVVTLPANSTTLRGTASDPDGSVSRYQWTKTSGPGVTISNPAAVQSGINGLVEGVYIFTLTVTDDRGTTASDDVQVTVKRASRNQTPWANAGTDRTHTLPGSWTRLSGFGIDPDGTIVGYRWVKFSGPANNIYFRMTGSTTTTPLVSGLKTGTYKFVLTVTDNNGGTGSDTMLLVVRSSTRGKSAVENSVAGDSTTNQKVAIVPSSEIVEEPSLTVFPNPVTTTFTARVKGFEIKEQLGVQLVSLTGATMKKIQMNFNGDNTEVKMDISNLPAGQYVLTVAGAKNKVSQRVSKVSSR